MKDIFTERFAKLNKQQQKAVTSIEGPVLVVAGPGSGKTEVLALRIAYILKNTDTPPGSILCLTFTDSASKNMRERLSQMIGSDAYKVAIHTFHSFGAECIRTYGYLMDDKESDTLDELGQIEIIQSIIESLPFDHIFRKKKPESEEFLYQRDLIECIALLKKNGIKPEEFRALADEAAEDMKLLNEHIVSLFSSTVTKALLAEVKSALLLPELQLGTRFSSVLPHYERLSYLVLSHLFTALERCEESGKTASLTEWKNTYTETAASMKRVLKGSQNTSKHQAIADMYASYQLELKKRYLKDYEDLLLTILDIAESHPHIKQDLSERYLYTLVDEFQDTSGLQLRLLNLAAHSHDHLSEPNLFAVGDDDQSIYKFQGANLTNILSFADSYETKDIITMTDNYRSTQEILDTASQCIMGAEERLCKVVPDIVKDLRSHRTTSDGYVTRLKFQNSVEEDIFIARDIERKLAKGEVSEIAVIARRHSDLKGLIPLLNKHSISYVYEKSQDIFQNECITGLITQMSFIAQLQDAKDDIGWKDFVPILSLPFWEVAPTDMWKLSTECYKEKISWIDHALASEDGKIKDIVLLYLNLSKQSENVSVSYLIDLIVGIKEISDDETAGYGSSPMYQWYFDEASRQVSLEDYIDHLSALRVFRDKIRSGSFEHLGLSDIVSKLKVLINNRMEIPYNRLFQSSGNARVTLLTSHKAKGLEFDTVYVMHANNEVWNTRGKSSTLTLPLNLPLRPGSDTLDDALRLFFVAETRAKRCLITTEAVRDAGGRELSPFSGLAEISPVDSTEVFDIAQDSDIPVYFFHKQHPLYSSFRDLVLEALSEYVLSVTHLERFLDLAYGGPEEFVERHILHFPESKDERAMYGTLVHAVARDLLGNFKKSGELPDVALIPEYIDAALSHEDASKREKEEMRSKALIELPLWYTQSRDSWSVDDVVEASLGHGGVRVGTALIQGKIDRLCINTKDQTITVLDYKSGNPVLSRIGKTDSEKIKMWKYETQLLFYKILIEGSGQYKGYSVNKGVIEFFAPSEDQLVRHEFDLAHMQDESTRLKKLIEVVYERIISLDFPDVSQYAQNLRGIEEFIASLIA